MGAAHILSCTHSVFGFDLWYACEKSWLLLSWIINFILSNFWCTGREFYVSSWCRYHQASKISSHISPTPFRDAFSSPYNSWLFFTCCLGERNNIVLKQKKVSLPNEIHFSSFFCCAANEIRKCKRLGIIANLSFHSFHSYKMIGFLLFCFYGKFKCISHCILGGSIS